MQRHGIEWEKKKTHEKHLSVLDYKKEQRTKEIAALETVKAEKESEVAEQEQRLSELAPAVKNMERLAADFPPTRRRFYRSRTLETSRAYREKKAKPLLAQIVKVLRSCIWPMWSCEGNLSVCKGLWPGEGKQCPPV